MVCSSVTCFLLSALLHKHTDTLSITTDSPKWARDFFSDNISVIKRLAVLIFHSLTAWFTASSFLPVETSTPVDGQQHYGFNLWPDFTELSRQELPGKCTESVHLPGAARTVAWEHHSAWTLQGLSGPKDCRSFYPPLRELLKYIPSFGSLLLIAFFSVSRCGHFHASVFYFYSAFGLASSCLLSILLCFISHLHDIFLRDYFFLMFYI